MRHRKVILAVLVLLLGVPQPVSAHWVSRALVVGGGGAHFSSHPQPAQFGCGNNSHNIELFLTWGPVEANRVFIQRATIVFDVKQGVASGGDTWIRDDFGNSFDFDTWGVYGVGRTSRVGVVNRWFRHDGLQTVRLFAQSFNGNNTAFACSNGDGVQVS